MFNTIELLLLWDISLSTFRERIVLSVLMFDENIENSHYLEV